MRLLVRYLVLCGLLFNILVIIAIALGVTLSSSVTSHGFDVKMQEIFGEHPFLMKMFRRTIEFRMAAGGDESDTSQNNDSKAIYRAPVSMDDFRRRCSSPGVIRCIGFDDQSDLALGQIMKGGINSTQPTIDNRIVSSGTGSLHFVMPSETGPNGAGGWLFRIKGPGSVTFGPGNTMFVQFRQRFDNNFLTSRFSHGGWKQVIFFKYPDSCGALEITTANLYWRGFPQMYTHCGAKPLQRPVGKGDYLLQQSQPDSGGYECHYQNPERSNCGWYRPDQWITFYYEIRIGNWGKPNSVIRAWMAYEGEPLWQFIDYTDHVMTYNNGPDDGIDSILLTPYSTDKKRETKHPPANTWYDELIISTRPIPAPTR